MKKNKVFVNKISERINNNQSLCNVMEEDNNLVKDNLTVKDKITKLFNTNGYVFNTKVKIITDDKIYDTKIASQIGNTLITLDNDIICIDTIKDIVF